MHTPAYRSIHVRSTSIRDGRRTEAYRTAGAAVKAIRSSSEVRRVRGYYVPRTTRSDCCGDRNLPEKTPRGVQHVGTTRHRRRNIVVSAGTECFRITRNGYDAFEVMSCAHPYLPESRLREVPVCHSVNNAYPDERLIPFRRCSEPNRYGRATLSVYSHCPVAISVYF